jgi:hypothetical protein
MVFNPNLVINSSDSAKGGFDKSGNFYVAGLKATGRLTQSVNGAKAGATAGWVVAGATNKALVTLPASQTASTLVIPLDGLRIGDEITGFSLVGQLDSAGNAVTLDAQLRKMTVATAGNTDALVGSMTQVSVTADTALSSTNTSKTVSDTVGADETFYMLITGTTAAVTTAEIQGVIISIN